MISVKSYDLSGDKLTLDIYTPPTDPWLDCLYSTDDFAAYNKPSGLLSVPGRDICMKDSLLERVRESQPSAEAVHRLDMPTSGIMLIAFDKEVERNLKRQFSDRVPKKVYEALVWGHITQPVSTIDAPLICDWPNRPRQKVCVDNGKASQTLCRVINYEGNYTRIELTPITGRSHQLRVHMQLIGHPILGDEFYAHNEAKQASNRLNLHAKYLQFRHPLSDKLLELHSKVPF